MERRENEKVGEMNSWIKESCLKFLKNIMLSKYYLFLLSGTIFLSLKISKYSIDSTFISNVNNSGRF